MEGQPLDEVNPAIEQLYKHPWEYPPGSSESFNDLRAPAEIPGPQDVPGGQRGSHAARADCDAREDIALTQSYIDGILPEKAEHAVPAGYALVRVAEDRSLEMEIFGKTET